MLIYRSYSVAEMHIRDKSDQEASVHAHVMKLLSATVNASLSELGHFPGSGLVLQELRQQNQHFRDVTVKMHQDNATLQRVVDRQNQDIIMLQNQAEDFRREFRQLNEKLRKVIIERDNVVSYARMCVFVLANMDGNTVS